MIDTDSSQQPGGGQQQQQFITFIKELASANNKLKTDLLECRDLLSETRHEVITLNGRIEDLEKENNGSSNNSSGDEQQQQQQERLHQQWPTRAHERVLSTSAPSHDDDTLIKWPPVVPSNSLSSRKQKPTHPMRNRSLLRSRRATSLLIPPPKDLPTIIPSPTASSSTPTQKQAAASIVHHHYHYHMQQQQQQQPQHPHQKQASQQQSYDPSMNLNNEDDTLAPLQKQQKKDITSLPKKILVENDNMKEV